LTGVTGAGTALGAVFGAGAVLAVVFGAALAGVFRAALAPVFGTALAGDFRAGAALGARVLGAGASLTLSIAWEPAAAERAFLRGLIARDGVEAEALAAPAFALGGESVLFDFINDNLRKTCHKAGLTITEPLPPCNQKF